LLKITARQDVVLGLGDRQALSKRARIRVHLGEHALTRKAAEVPLVHNVVSHAASDNAVFLQALEKYFGSAYDPLTLQRL
jgi:hypothetical protein